MTHCHSIGEKENGRCKLYSKMLGQTYWLATRPRAIIACLVVSNHVEQHTLTLHQPSSPAAHQPSRQAPHTPSSPGGRPAARRLLEAKADLTLQLGKLLTPVEANTLGLLDEVVPAAALLPAATRAMAGDGAGDSGGDARRRQRRTVAGQKAAADRHSTQD